MIVRIRETSRIRGSLQLPTSKSYSIRAFLIAACGGTSQIGNPSDCDDAVVSRQVARSLGAKIRSHKKTFSVSAPRGIFVSGNKIQVKESGTVLRLVLPLLCLTPKNVVVKGEGTLKGRPNLFLTKVLRKMGCRIRGTGPQESIPITIEPGKFRGGKIKIDATLSSQFISALLITCPQLNDDTHLTLTGKRLVSSDYITMTQQVLRQSGIRIQQKDARNFLIKGRQHFRGLKNFQIPSDYGLAAFPMAAAALVSSNVTLKGFFNDKFLQADGHILPILKKMGVKFQKTSRAIKIKGPFSLKGGQFYLKNCPDLVPILSVLALFAKGQTRLTGIGHVRAKESDRISDLRKELLKIGAKVSEKKDELIIRPVREYRRNRILDPHKDHRLAMAFCILGLKLGVRVKDIECVKKSYPCFLSDLKSLMHPSKK